MKQKKLSLFIAFLFLFPFLSLSQAGTIKDLKNRVKLPNSGWEYDKDYLSEADVITGMYPKKTGRAVNLRINFYNYVGSSDKFLEGVRDKLLEKDAYKNAEMRFIDKRKLDGNEWSTFKLKRKDGIVQELWGRSGSDSNVLFVMYTTAGDDYFKDYYSDFETVLNQLVKLY
ncbi:MAG: hypothetical protein JNK65_04905 [Deltaproteobacteria bacterium]|nr:hypothetical protein [Deltaproteobacteria bacterium]